jgi:hypothetical protein
VNKYCCLSHASITTQASKGGDVEKILIIKDKGGIGETFELLEVKIGKRDSSNSQR